MEQNSALDQDRVSSENGVLAKREATKVKFYDADDVTNQIPYFDNRFRLDAHLEEIILLFYRKSGSVPIVLVRPDGSKLKINNFPKEQVEWFDDRTFDMIKIKKPMPGPWQAVGDILPGSEIMVVSEIKLEVSPLPPILLSGETLKMTGRLFNGEQAIDNPLFRDVIKLDVNFFSTNNSAYDNFGAEPVKLTSFRDNGQDLDERAKDGIFTGEFKFDFASGEWAPIYAVNLPMVSRELKQKPVIIQTTPISITVDVAKDESAIHKVHFVIDGTYVDPDSLILQGKITYPDTQEEPFSVMEGFGAERIKEFDYAGPGVHRIKIRAYGRTINGREFRLVVPEFTFNVDRIVNDFTGSVNLNVNAGDDSSTQVATENDLFVQQLEAQLIENKMAADKAQQDRIFIIVAANVIIILMALSAFFVVRWKKQKIK